MTNAPIRAGVLIDTTYLNRRIDYDPATHEISFGPSVRVKELAEFLAQKDRFYPHGQCPSVTAVGFQVGAGQGVGIGKVVTASRSENADLFWAARWSGPPFFGVISKFWGRSIRRKKWWH
ncbi:hypothetical protein ACJZ2D_008648 [Fusarium nematophilum]